MLWKLYILIRSFILTHAIISKSKCHMRITIIPSIEKSNLICLSCFGMFLPSSKKTADHSTISTIIKLINQYTIPSSLISMLRKIEKHTCWCCGKYCLVFDNNRPEYLTLFSKQNLVGSPFPRISGWRATLDYHEIALQIRLSSGD